MIFIILTLTLLVMAWLIAKINRISWEHALFAVLFISH